VQDVVSFISFVCRTGQGRESPLTCGQEAGLRGRPLILMRQITGLYLSLSAGPSPEILEVWDEMAEAMRTGRPYQTRVDPPPGPPADGLPDWPPGGPRPANWPSKIHPPRGLEP